MRYSGSRPTRSLTEASQESFACTSTLKEAVKAIDASHVRDDEAVARFQREARLIARLEHVHILPVYDFDGTHDPPYIVMRYLEGGTVRDVLAQGPLPLDEVAYLLQQIGSALHYAHRQGIVHRDVKPANILIDTEGNAFVSDFGIARILDESARRGEFLTMTGSSVGTPAYMAPEQIQGQSHVDARVDIYALGALLFEMVTGELPFQGPSLVQLLYQHLNDPVPDPRTLRPDLPPTFGSVIERAMAKEPQDRYGTAEAFVAAAIDVDEAGAQANALYLLAQNATRVGHWEVALAHLDRAQELVRGTAERGILARVLYGLGDARFRSGQLGEARSACQEALVIARETGDRLTEMNALNRLGTVEMSLGQAQEATRHFEECRILAREVGNPYREMWALGNLGEVARFQGDYALAHQHTEEALALSREIEDLVGLVVGALNLASLKIDAGLLPEAQGLIAEAAQTARRSGSITWLVGTAWNMAFLRVAQGRIDEALAILGLAWEHPALGSDAGEDTEYWIMPRLEQTLTPDEIQAGMTKGCDLDLDEVIDAFLAEAT